MTVTSTTGAGMPAEALQGTLQPFGESTMLPREAYTKLQRDWALPTPDVAP